MGRVSDHGLKGRLGLLWMRPPTKTHVKVDVPLANDSGALGSLQFSPEMLHHFLQDDGVLPRRRFDLRRHFNAFGVEGDIGVLIGGDEVEEFESRECYRKADSLLPPLFAASL